MAILLASKYALKREPSKFTGPSNVTSYRCYQLPELPEHKLTDASICLTDISEHLRVSMRHVRASWRAIERLRRRYDLSQVL